MSVVSPTVKVYGTLKYGKEVRIDDGCIFTGDVVLGDYVHIGPYCVFHGRAGINVGSFCGFASFMTIHTTCDDFSGLMLFGPTVPEQFRGVKYTPLRIGDYFLGGVKSSIIGVSNIPQGTALGAHSCLMKEPQPWGIYAGVPAKRIEERQTHCAKLANIVEAGCVY